MFNNLSQDYDLYYEHDTSNLKINFQLLKSLEKKYEKIYLVQSVNTKKELDQYINFLYQKKVNEKILFFLIGPIPNFNDKYLNPLTCLIQKLNCEIKKNKDFKERLIFKKNLRIKNLINKKNNVKFFDIYNILCPLEKCSVYDVKKDFLMLRDQSHLSYESSLSISSELNKFIKKLN